MSVARARHPEWPWALAACGAWIALLAHPRGGGMAGMAMPRPFVGELAWWSVMAAATMVPPALPALRAFGLARPRTPALLMAIFLTAWAAFGAAALAAWTALGPGDGATAASLALFAAAAWEVTPYKRRCLERCARIAPRGATWRAGARHAAASIGSCGPLMLPMVALHSAALMVPLAALGAWQRLAGRPRPGVSAGLLAVLAEVVLATAV
jgi:predicted metal-binding membrane protein